MSVLHAAAQQADTADKMRIVIANSGSIEFLQTDSGAYNKFVDDVVLYQGTDTMYCDSLYYFKEKKKLEAFGNVRIAQAEGTQGNCDYLRYMSDKKLAYMTGNVSLTDGKNTLWCQDLTYELDTKVGVFTNRGILKSDSTTLASDAGVYNVRSHDARFTGNVVIADLEYRIASRDLGYNTETKVETFYDYSVVTSDSGRSVLATWSGTYDSKNVVARFTGHSSIWNDGQYIEADSLHYDKLTGYGYAIGHVISVDTAQHATIYCGRADYFRKQRVLWATVRPVMELATAKDTFFMRADTFYSAPMVRAPGSRYIMPVDSSLFALADSTKPLDSLRSPAKELVIVKEKTHGKRHRKGKKKEPVDSAAIPVAVVDDSTWIVPPLKYRLADFVKDTTPVVVQTGRGRKKHFDTVRNMAPVDTTSPVFFTGYHHVKLYSDSMQGRCDSITVTRSDSLVRLMYDPVAWARGSQITGDTILLQMDSSSVRCMYVPESAFMASRSGPEQAKLFDQVQGRTLTAFFHGNSIDRMVVRPDAQSLYYARDESGAYIGLDEASGVVMKAYFGAESLETIKFEQDVKQKVTPMEKADLDKAKLSRFIWRYDERPKSRQELFE